MTSKLEIDRLRDSAASMAVGDGSDGSITGMIKIGDRLHIIKQGAVYRISMADEIDPSRTRADIPNTQQMVLNAGSDSDVVRRILLTAAELFRNDRLLEYIDWNAALSTALGILEDAIAAQEIANEFETLKADAESRLAKPEGRAFRIPAIVGLEARTKSLIQKADHGCQGIYSMCALFIPESEMRAAGKWLDGFSAAVAQRFGSADDSFAAFSASLADFGKLVRNVRHCIEHKKPTQHLEILDYSLTADRILQPPTIRVIHPETPTDTVSLGIFMNDIVRNLIEYTELLMAYLAERHIKPFGRFPILVGELPKGQGDGATYGYLVEMGDQYVRLS